MIDKKNDPQFQEFFEQMDQLNRLYQKAVVLLAVKSIVEKQDRQGFQLVTPTPPKIRISHWVGNIFQALKRLIQKAHQKKRGETASVSIRHSTTRNHIMHDESDVVWFEDRPLYSEDNNDKFPIVIYPIDKKKGNDSHE
jgi:hypothetical protein